MFFSRILKLVMRSKENQVKQAVSDVNLEPLHEEVFKLCRGKQSRYFLEAECGVGATRSREYMIRPVALRYCEYCSSKSYLCLGKGCMGKSEQAAVMDGSKRQQEHDFSQPRVLPGQLYKTSSCRIARNPGPKKAHSMKVSNHPKTPIPRRKKSGRQSMKDGSVIFKASSPTFSRVKKSKVFLIGV